jgi:hypothetical protein
MGVFRNENAAARFLRDTQQQEKCSSQQAIASNHDFDAASKGKYQNYFWLQLVSLRRQDGQVKGGCEVF